MSVPMEITLPTVTNQEEEAEKEKSIPVAVSQSVNLSLLDEGKILVSVEVCLNPSSTVRIEDVHTSIERMLEKRSLSYADGPVPWVENHEILLFWQVKPAVHVFQLSEEGPGEELSGDGQLSSFNEWILPAKEFDGMWESIVLLHGPPGTGKTSLCKALAQKLTIRFSFSSRLRNFLKKIQKMVEEDNSLVFVLIDEVESLAAARNAALSGSEPSDSIRVVNALLTQMDKLKCSPNVIILTTSNITAAIGTPVMNQYILFIKNRCCQKFHFSCQERF
ncbi:hypothetical protein MKX01_038133 [Papaver californicum]|nr:hypothetical protein MKX01_038133 [Papaver californicum]